MNKSKVEKHNNPAELYELRKARDRAEVDAGKAAAREVHRNLALEREMERARLATRVETVYGWENVDEEEMERADKEQMARIMESMASRSKTRRGPGVRDDDLCADLFGDLAEKREPEPESEDDVVLDDASVELTPDELAAKAALIDVGGGADQMATLVQVAHARRAEAEEKARKKQEEKARRQREEEEAAAASKPGARADARTRVAAAHEAAQARLALQPADEVENRQAQEEEMMVLESIFGEDDCGVDAEQHAVKLTIRGTDRAGCERTITVHIRMGPDYPSHLPPECYRLEGVDADDVPLVVDLLHLVYYDNDLDPNSVCVMQWAEWLRDEYMAKQMRCECGAQAKSGTRAGAPAVARVRHDDWMDFSMAKGKN